MTSRQRTHSGFLRIAAILALIAVLVPLATTLLYHPAAVRSFIHICGVTHLRGEDSKSPLHKLPPCPLYQNIHLIGTGLIPPMAMIVPLIAGIVFFRSTRRSFSVLFSLIPHARPRAPPAVL